MVGVEGVEGMPEVEEVASLFTLVESSELCSEQFIECKSGLMRMRFSCLGDLVRFTRLDPAFPILMPFLMLGSLWRKPTT